MMLYFQKLRISFCARFGNVANSSGSVFPIWQNQIKHSNKITITDPEATRYLIYFRSSKFSFRYNNTQ